MLLLLIFVVVAGALGWFCYPAARDVVLLERENLRISALTRQTRRDMDHLARRQRPEGS